MKKNILALASLLAVTSFAMQSSYAQMQIVDLPSVTGGEYTGLLYDVGNAVAPQPDAPKVIALIQTPSGQLSIVINQADLPFGKSLAGAVGHTVKVVTPDNKQVTSITVLPGKPPTSTTSN